MSQHLNFEVSWSFLCPPVGFHLLPPSEWNLYGVIRVWELKLLSQHNFINWDCRAKTWDQGDGPFWCHMTGSLSWHGGGTGKDMVREKLVGQLIVEINTWGSRQRDQASGSYLTCEASDLPMPHSELLQCQLMTQEGGGLLGRDLKLILLCRFLHICCVARGS